MTYLAQRYPKITLSEERQLILKAQKGSKKSKDELVLRHIGFLIFRIHKVAFPEFIKRFGEDLLEEAILIVYIRRLKAMILITAISKGILTPLNLFLISGRG